MGLQWEAFQFADQRVQCSRCRTWFIRAFIKIVKGSHICRDVDACKLRRRPHEARAE